MDPISRNDIYIRSESGGETLDAFWRQLQTASTPTIQDLLNTMAGKRNQSVESIVQSYREQVGLDLVTADETDGDIKTADKKDEFNDQGGLTYTESDEIERAKKADLLTLPPKVEGTNCANCKFLASFDDKTGIGVCGHPEVKLKVTPKMCCAFWFADGSLRQWETKKTASTLGPIAPMKLKKITKLEDMLKDYKPEDLWIQQKIDGFKTMAIKIDGSVNLYTRRGEKFSDNVPNVVKALSSMPNSSFILGELTWIGKDGKQSISDIQTVVGSNPDKAQKHADGNVVFYIYDLLWLNGKDITKTPYSDRYNKLKSIKLSKPVQLVKNYTWAEKDTAIKDALAVGGEGIVIKPKNSHYEYGKAGSNEPVGEMVKFKPGAKAKEADVIVKSYTKGKEKLVFPAFQYKGKELVEVGQVSGLPKEDETKVKSIIDTGKSVVLEVGYQERMESGKFRHIGYHRIRSDKPAKEVKMAYISKRHIQKISSRVVSASLADIFQKHPEIVKDIDSLCQHSGGHKSLHSILNFLRDKLGPELISFSDEELIKYIENKKSQYTVDPHTPSYEAGLVGVQDQDYSDNQAEYFKTGK